MTTPSEAANNLKSTILEHRETTEQGRQVAPAIVEKLKETKLCRLGLPKHLGGWEDDPVEVLRVYEALSSAEASVGWMVWNNHLACTFGRYLQPAARDAIYGNDDHIYANSARPEGVATSTEGGYRVNGRWSLVSGCETSDWLALRCVVKTGDGPAKPGPGVPLKLFYIPRSETQIIDTWQVGGLRGTGSHDVQIEDVFVPSDYAVAIEGEVTIDHPYSRLPVGAMNAAGCGSIALGVARSAHDALVKMGTEKVTPGKNPDLRDRPQIQSTVAQASAGLNSARMYLHSATAALWDAVQKAEELSDTLLATVWEASCHAANVSRTAVSDIYAVAGTESLYESSPIERTHRDIHAVLLHGIIQPHWMSQAGMTYMGLQPSIPMFRT